MTAILDITAPYYVLFTVGFLAVTTGLMTPAWEIGLNRFVYLFAMPCLLFDFGSSIPVDKVFPDGVRFAYIMSSIVMSGLSAWLFKRMFDVSRDAAGATMTAVMPNNGNLGVPLLLAILGKEAVGPTIGTIVVDNLVTIPLCMAISSASSASDGRMRSVVNLLRPTLRSPMPWAIALGMVFSGFGVHKPALLDHTAGMLGQAATPIALFSIGASLARFASRDMLRGRGDALRLLLPSVVKLFGHPLIILAMLWLVALCGGAISPTERTTLAVVAGLPTSISAGVLAANLGAQPRIAAITISMTTIFSFFTVPLLVQTIHR